MTEAKRIDPVLAFHVSQADFADALECLLEEKRDTLSLREIIAVRRARRNPRVMARLYRETMQDVPGRVYETGFDAGAFLDWLSENLPTILRVLATLLMFL